jgi:hypothetical protein
LARQILLLRQGVGQQHRGLEIDGIMVAQQRPADARRRVIVEERRAVHHRRERPAKRRPRGLDQRPRHFRVGQIAGQHR